MQNEETLQKVHSDEQEVKVAMAVNDEKTKQLYFNKLRLKGNHMYNVRALRSGEGQLLVLRRPKAGEEHSTEDYMPCPDCVGYVYKKDLWKHRQTCTAANHDEAEETVKGKKRHLAESQHVLTAAVKSTSAAMSDLEKYVLTVMVNDSIKIVAKN